MKREHLLIAVALGAWALLTYLFYPGHAWLRQDSQIYVALFLHLDNATVLARDLMSVHPHLHWTLYDEVARSLHAWTGLSYHVVLDAQMLVLRWIALVGVYLLARRTGLARWGALLAAVIYGLGTFAGGPEVLGVEYEPVPRGFALSLTLAAFGFLAHRRWWIASSLAAAGLLYHPPTAAIYWLVALVVLLVTRQRDAWLPLLVTTCAAMWLLIAGAYWQIGERDAQPHFARLAADLAPLLRYRGSYLWVERWSAPWMWHYVLYAALGAWAWWRVRAAMSRECAAITATLLGYGLASIPLAWIVWSQIGWTMMSQFQPARAALFVLLIASLLCLAVALGEVAQRRWVHAAAWLLPVFALPFNQALPNLLISVSALLVIALSVAAGWILIKKERLVFAVPVLAVALLPSFGRVSHLAPLSSPELDALVRWAAHSTPPDAIFQFADAGRATAPGVFRVQAQRALYADWKGGGQVNQSFAFAREWQRRWTLVGRSEPPLHDAAYYRALGIDYVVLNREHKLSDALPIYENMSYRVYQVRR